MSEPVVSCRDLCKHFHSGASFTDLLRGRLRGQRVEALRGVSLEVTRGELVALVGPNGVGKSTLLRLLAGLLLPDSGQLQVLGRPAEQASPSFAGRVCYVVSDERSFSWRLTGRQNIEFFAALYGLTGPRARRRSGEVLELVGLLAPADRPVREYSSGMRQRLALARGLLGEPELMLFDELTRGVDPQGAARLRQLILQELRAHGRTAVLATHDLSDVTQLCERVIGLDAGRVVLDAPAADAAELVFNPPARAAR